MFEIGVIVFVGAALFIGVILGYRMQSWPRSRAVDTVTYFVRRFFLALFLIACLKALLLVGAS